jgi:hypothetical protein
MTLEWITPNRMIEMVEAATAREGENSLTEKAAMWSTMLVGFKSMPRSSPVLLDMWATSMIDLMADIIRAYHPDPEERDAFVKNHLTPTSTALQTDLNEALKGKK